MTTVSHHQRLRVRVTRTDIRRSLRGYPKWGPLSWGVFRLDPSIRASVYAASVIIHEREFRTGLVLNYALSRRARKFLRDFDARKPVKPFTTILRLVPHRLEQKEAAEIEACKCTCPLCKVLWLTVLQEQET